MLKKLNPKILDPFTKSNTRISATEKETGSRTFLPCLCFRIKIVPQQFIYSVLRGAG